MRADLRGRGRGSGAFHAVDICSLIDSSGEPLLVGYLYIPVNLRKPTTISATRSMGSIFRPPVVVSGGISPTRRACQAQLSWTFWFVGVLDGMSGWRGASTESFAGLVREPASQTGQRQRRPRIRHRSAAPGGSERGNGSTACLSLRTRMAKASAPASPQSSKPRDGRLPG